MLGKGNPDCCSFVNKLTNAPLLSSVMQLLSTHALRSHSHLLRREPRTAHPSTHQPVRKHGPPRRPRRRRRPPRGPLPHGDEKHHPRSAIFTRWLGRDRRRTRLGHPLGRHGKAWHILPAAPRHRQPTITLEFEKREFKTRVLDVAWRWRAPILRYSNLSTPDRQTRAEYQHPPDNVVRVVRRARRGAAGGARRTMRRPLLGCVCISNKQPRLRGALSCAGPATRGGAMRTLTACGLRRTSA